MSFPSSSWTLQDVMTKVRNVTGTVSTDQMSDQQIVDYINKYYVFTLPFELKEQVQLETLKFVTNPNQDTYSFQNVGVNFLTDQPMAYADGFPLIFYQDPDIFYQDWPLEYAVDFLATGVGGTAPLTVSGGLQNPPLIAGSLIITDGVTLFQDNGAGKFTEKWPLSTQPLPTLNSNVGSINYITGAFNVQFTKAPAASATIYGKYLGYQANRPQGILFFGNNFILRPVPDQVYTIQMQGYVQPVQFTVPTDQAQPDSQNTQTIQPELGHLIALGAACDIFEDRGDTEKYNEYYERLKRYENVALARTVQQFQAEQSVPRF